VPEQADESRLKLTIVALVALVAVTVAVPLFILLLIVGRLWWIAPIIGLIVGVSVVWHLHRSAFRRVMQAFVPIAGNDVARARLENLVEGLSLSIGTSEPELLVVADEARNALAVARGDEKAIIITDSLLVALDRIELEGVVAALLIRLKNGDAERATSMASLVGKPFLDSGMSTIAAPLGGLLLRRNLSEYRDILSDQQAVAITRYPPGLSAALGRIAVVSAAPLAATPGTDHLWMVPPARLDSLVPHAPLDWRVEALLET
jgi:Zn-dependent protease with chaperone function